MTVLLGPSNARSCYCKYARILLVLEKMIRVGWLHFADAEKVREKFSKLLLGEDMSGTGKGVTSALALSNAITNLAGNNFSLSHPSRIISFLSFPFLSFSKDHLFPSDF